MRYITMAAILAALLCAGCHRTPAKQHAAQASPVDQAAAPLESVNSQPSLDEAENGQGFAPDLALATDGLVVLDGNTGAPSPIRFGTEQSQAAQHIDAAIGKAIGQRQIAGCTGGAASAFDYKGGLSLYFQNKQFVGWDFHGEAGYTTMLGIGIGSSYGDLQSMGVVQVKDTAAGHEFSSNGLRGLLGSVTPLGKVTNLWAGTTCTTP